MKRKNRAPSASTTPPDGKKKKTASENADGASTAANNSMDFSSPQRVVESLLSSTNLDSFFDEHWEKKPHFVKRENADFYGSLFSKKDLEAVLKKEEIQFIEDVALSRYVEGKTELLNEEGRVNLKHIKAAGVAVQFHQPDRFKDEVWRLVELLETYFTCLVGADAYVFQPGSQGLAPQFDEMETFILQLEGKTKWTLFKPLQELPQEASPDLELSDLGDPSHDFDLEPGDLLYFPRGTVYFPVPIEDKDHATHLAITTFQENSWGNLLTSALSKAVERAMESDVEYRRGLPVNLSSFMGSTLNDPTQTEDSSEQNGDQKSEKDAEKDTDIGPAAKPANPRMSFNENLIKLLKGLVRHLSPDKALDDMLRDFFGCRLPPFAGKDAGKKGKKKSPAPSDDSKIKLSHPDHVRVLIGDLSDGVAGTDESDEEMSEAEEEEEEDVEGSEEEESEESEEEKKGSKKGAKKAQGKAKKKNKAQGKKAKSKKAAESEEEEEEEEMDEDEEESEKEEKKGAKKPQEKKKKSDKAQDKKAKSKKAAESEEEEEEEEMDEDDDDEGSGDENDGFGNEEGGDEYILVLHSVKNDRSTHMMGDKSPCSILKFPFRYKDALRQITTTERDKYTAVSSLKLAEKERLSMVKSLWEEGLLDVQ